MKRAPNLTEERVTVIIGILDGWTGPLTWNSLISAIASRVGCHYTRQALHKHGRIQAAFEVRKANATPASPPRGSVQLQKASERIERLEAENQRLNAENDRLLEQFARWAYNAYVRGLGEAELNRPLPEIDRRRTPVLVKPRSHR